MEKIKLETSVLVNSADTITAVSVYLKLRDLFPNAILLESSDYHGNEHSYSYICCKPIAKFEVIAEQIKLQYPNQKQQTFSIANDKKQVISRLDNFRQSFITEEQDYPFISGGLFGYSTYDAVEYFEDLTIKQVTNKMPKMLYQVFSIVICIDHFRDKFFIFEHKLRQQQSIINSVIIAIKNQRLPETTFKTIGEEQSNYTDQEFLEIIQKGITHCQRGDVFQIVLSRQFYQHFTGDDFNVYRTLRSINPSPYLFYFDYGGYKILGSSPEAQLVIKGKQAIIYPIAGTFKRTGDDQKDYQLAKKLFDDEKETAEHSMLVDLARNDLSKQSKDVKVEFFKDIQYYSHVIHMVSKVVAEIENLNSLQLFADTFPAGTLSGAPKYRAMELINFYEKTNREFYGGAIGYIGFNGDLNHAIMIRTLFSKNNKLIYQAGGGIVVKSNSQSELQEVNNKKAALKSAIENAISDNT